MDMGSVCVDWLDISRNESIFPLRYDMKADIINIQINLCGRAHFRLCLQSLIPSMLSVLNFFYFFSRTDTDSVYEFDNVLPDLGPRERNEGLSRVHFTSVSI